MANKSCILNDTFINLSFCVSLRISVEFSLSVIISTAFQRTLQSYSYTNYTHNCRRNVPKCVVETSDPCRRNVCQSMVCRRDVRKEDKKEANQLRQPLTSVRHKHAVIGRTTLERKQDTDATTELIDLACHIGVTLMSQQRCNRQTDRHTTR